MCKPLTQPVADGDLVRIAVGSRQRLPGRSDTATTFSRKLTLFGGNGNDALSSLVRDSVIDGGAGNDDMGSGDFSGVLATNDVFVFLPGYERDLIRGFTGNDKVLLQGFGITSFAQLQQYMTVSVNVTAGIHIFTATIMLNGSDVLTITGRGDGPSAAHFIFDVPPAPVTADNTIQRLTGGEDTIQISSNQNTIYGAEGNDTFTGTTNRSTLEGGAGGDSFNLDLSSNNALLGGDDGSGDSLFVTGGMGNYLMGAGGNDWLGVGQSGATASTNNTLGGGDGDDSLNATGTGNTLIGGAGQDQFAAVGNQNRLFGEDGNDSAAGQRRFQLARRR